MYYLTPVDAGPGRPVPKLDLPIGNGEIRAIPLEEGEWLGGPFNAGRRNQLRGPNLGYMG